MCLQKLIEKLIDCIITIKLWTVLGGHCGLCGAWVPLAEVEHYWPWTVCERCLGEEAM